MSPRPRAYAGLAVALSLASAFACDKTRACKAGTALLDLRFAAPAQMGDRVDLTIDVTDEPHETITGSLPLNEGTRGGTAEVRFKNPYRPGAHMSVLARAMRGDEIVEEISTTATLTAGCSRIVIQNGGTAPVDASQDAPPSTSDGGSVDRGYVEVGGQSDGCAGSCIPGQTVACGKCGTKTCGTNCTWGECSSEGECLAGSTQACGNCGIQVCDPTCHWSTTCAGQGECKAGDSTACGTCGRKTCSAACAWGTCDGDSTCSPGATRTCGRCGTEACTTTGTGCGWSGVCTGEGACSPGSTRPCGTGNCGTEACGPDCKWTGTCQNPGECVPGAVGGCGNCGTRTCTTACKWPTDAASCTGQGACAPGATSGCGNCGTVTCNNSCQWGACAGEGSCTPGDSITCGACDNGVQLCTSTCNWGVCKGGTTTCCTAFQVSAPDGTAMLPICLPP